MSLVNIIKLSLHFTERRIFHEMGLQVRPQDRIGLVGPNGSGKTSLLRLLVGEVSPDGGEIRVAKGTRVGYLPQDVQEGLSGPLLRTVLDSVPGRVDLKQRLQIVQHELKEASGEQDQSRVARTLAGLHQEMDLLERDFPAHEAEKILEGLGFASADFASPISQLSGGWKMRAALAGLLYCKPDLLLLDEPTNHLDIPSVRWLEGYLRDFSGAMLLVSHDRDFLNRQINRVVSLEPEFTKTYTGNYDFYLKAREEDQRTLDAKARNQEQKIKDAEKFIERFRSKASKARQAQSKIKLLKKMEVVESRQKEKTIRFSFPQIPRSGRNVVSIKGLSKGFGGNALYTGINLTVQRGDRIAIIGPNGSGKTTLLRMVSGEMEPDEGKSSLGHGVGLGYFAQHHSDTLNPRRTVIQEVSGVVPQESVGFVRSVCGAFLFSGNDVEKPVGVLSGGEKARVSLAKLLVKPENLMVMDEPTNHLDIASSEKLIDALEEFTGTLLFVSHNQSFINRLATKIWDIGDGEIVEYPGNLEEYFDHIERQENAFEKEIGKGDGQKAKAGPGGETPKAQGGKRPSKKELKRARAEKRRIMSDALQPIREELERLEDRIAGLESKQKELEKVLADTEIFKDKNKSVPMINEYTANREKLDELLVRWERKQDRLESVKKELEA
jgi:ATP-binding cassette, subfamily F, member 3